MWRERDVSQTAKHNFQLRSGLVRFGRLSLKLQTTNIKIDSTKETA